MAVTRMKLHEIMMEFTSETVDQRKNRVLDFLKDYFSTNGDESASKSLVEYVRNSFFAPYFLRWRKAYRANGIFLSNNANWLNKEIVFPDIVYRCRPSSTSVPGTSRSSGGRPPKEFEDSSIVIKRRKTAELRKEKSAAELSFASAMKLHEVGNVDAAKLITEATTTTPTRASRILKSWRIPKQRQFSYSIEEAVAMLINLNLTRDQYVNMRRGAREHGHDLYPPYYKVLEAKKNFYPTNIAISEEKCEVPLQNLLDRTCESILKCVSLDLLEVKRNSLVLICKWGFDGSSSFSAYKQSKTRHDDHLRAEESLFTTSMVPLQLLDKESEEVLWKNPHPASKKFCRPIKLQWIQESEEISRMEQAEITAQIRQLQPYGSEMGPIQFNLLLTMVDGKVCSALSKTSSMTCHVCKAKISQMNDIVSVRSQQVDKETLQFGLSVLHAYIRCFECLLHISYRLELKVWKVTKKHREQFLARKKLIQNEFRRKMGLLVDIPKSGFGTTNDGNTARRFFANPALSAEITGIDEQLIHRFGVILRTVNSGYEIQVENFEQYCLRTAEKYIENYSWYYMPTSVHKLLIHGPLIVQYAILPIGELSEEAQEAKNKDIRLYRQRHTRKISAIHVNEDLFKRLLLSSDPYLSSLSLRKRKMKQLDADMQALVICSSEEEQRTEDEEEETSEDEEEQIEEDDENIEDEDEEDGSKIYTDEEVEEEDLEMEEDLEFE